MGLLTERNRMAFIDDRKLYMTKSKMGGWHQTKAFETCNSPIQITMIVRVLLRAFFFFFGAMFKRLFIDFGAETLIKPKSLYFTTR